MNIAIQYTEDCPNVERMETRVHQALAGRPSGATIRRELVATIDDARRVHFVGSPTMLVDGRDPFARPTDEPALASRLYATADGLDGAPTVEQLCAVFERCHENEEGP